MRLLIVRTSALGDIVHALPVLTALRRELPSARIGWVVEEGMAPLLDHHPDLDEVLTVRLRAWRKAPFTPRTWAEIGRFVRRLNAFQADVALDLMGNHKAGILAALSLADRRIGLAQSYRREPSSAFWISEGVPRLGPHAVEQALSVLSALGIEPSPPDFGGAKLCPQARLAAASDPGDVFLHPGANWANKIYPAERWGEVAIGLAAAGLRVSVAAGPGEEALAEAVARASGGAARQIPAGDLPGLVAVLRRARLVLGGDTGPIHLAHALGTPVLAVMGPTDPATHGPFAAPERAVAVRLPCSFCHKRFDGARPCLLALSPAVVLSHALALLAEPGPEGSLSSTDQFRDG